MFFAKAYSYFVYFVLRISEKCEYENAGVSTVAYQ